MKGWRYMIDLQIFLSVVPWLLIGWLIGGSGELPLLRWNAWWGCGLGDGWRPSNPDWLPCLRLFWKSLFGLHFHFCQQAFLHSVQMQSIAICWKCALPVVVTWLCVLLRRAVFESVKTPHFIAYSMTECFEAFLHIHNISCLVSLGKVWAVGGGKISFSIPFLRLHTADLLGRADARKDWVFSGTWLWVHTLNTFAHFCTVPSHIFFNSPSFSACFLCINPCKKYWL